MLTHDFFEVAPAQYSNLSELEIMDAILSRGMHYASHKISDKCVLRNIGYIDKQPFDAFNLSSFDGKRMKYFSSFINQSGEVPTIGISYYGVTVLNAHALSMLIKASPHAGMADSLRIHRFKKFCQHALNNNNWVIHLGV